MDYLWSRGCFATPEDINNKIISLTNNGCLVCVIDQIIFAINRKHVESKL